MVLVLLQSVIMMMMMMTTNLICSSNFNVNYFYSIRVSVFWWLPLVAVKLVLN